MSKKPPVYKTRVLRFEDREVRESELFYSAQEAFEALEESAQTHPDEADEPLDSTGLNRLGAKGHQRYSQELAAYALEVPRLNILVYGFRWSGGSHVRKRMERAGYEVGLTRGHNLTPAQCVGLMDQSWTASARGGWLGVGTTLDQLLGGLVKIHKPQKWKHMRLHYFRITYGGSCVAHSALIQPLPKG